MINSTEHALDILGTTLVAKSQPGWLLLSAHCPILGRGCGGITTIQKHADGDSDIPVGMDVFVVQEICLFLREVVQNTTGHRIWGLTFKLHPNGKFHIEYDYDRPPDYVETDETIDVNASDLARFRGS